MSVDAARAEIGDICSLLGLLATPGQLAALAGYLDLLERWNSTYNLTAIRDRASMVTQHLADCLALIPPLQQALPAGRVLDVGSGGGLPGVVIACMLPGLDVSCVDSVGKKVAFVRQVAGELGLSNLHAVHSRVEDLKPPEFNLITSRAFASLVDFTRLTQTSLGEGGVWLAMKGQRPDDEIAALPPEIDMFHVEPLSVPGLDAQRCLVWMRRRH